MVTSNLKLFQKRKRIIMSIKFDRTIRNRGLTKNDLLQLCLVGRDSYLSFFGTLYCLALSSTHFYALFLLKKLNPIEAMQDMLKETSKTKTKR